MIETTELVQGPFRCPIKLILQQNMEHHLEETSTWIKQLPYSQVSPADNSETSRGSESTEWMCVDFGLRLQNSNLCHYHQKVIDSFKPWLTYKSVCKKYLILEGHRWMTVYSNVPGLSDTKHVKESIIKMH